MGEVSTLIQHNLSNRAGEINMIAKTDIIFDDGSLTVPFTDYQNSWSGIKLLAGICRDKQQLHRVFNLGFLRDVNECTVAEIS